jgi:hypothetical protein
MSIDYYTGMCAHCARNLGVYTEGLPDVCDSGELTCEAFPDGIPNAIQYDGADHTKPYPGDHGITYMPREGRRAEMTIVIGTCPRCGGPYLDHGKLTIDDVDPGTPPRGCPSHGPTARAG